MKLYEHINIVHVILSCMFLSRRNIKTQIRTEIGPYKIDVLILDIIQAYGSLLICHCYSLSPTTHTHTLCQLPLTHTHTHRVSIQEMSLLKSLYRSRIMILAAVMLEAFNFNRLIRFSSMCQICNSDS